MGISDWGDFGVGQADATGVMIEAIYADARPNYVIYRTPQRVTVRFSDDQHIAAEQRRRLTRLSPLRGQIDGLLTEWRLSNDPDTLGRLHTMDARIAASLGIALEGDAREAEILLAKIHSDVLNERAASASVNYVVWAAAACAVAMSLACIFTWPGYGRIFDYSSQGEALWLGVGAGALGAFFSTAIAARSRRILPNAQRRRENRMDAIMRIAIGSIAGMLLAGLLKAELISFSIGGATSAGEAGTWMMCAFGAFVAGFSERLIPGLLERSVLPGASESPVPTQTREDARLVAPVDDGATSNAWAAKHPVETERFEADVTLDSKCIPSAGVSRTTPPSDGSEAAASHSSEPASNSLETGRSERLQTAPPRS